jgi:hypothetical protein
MSRIFITGSSDGLGQMAARLLVDQDHRVVLHARNASRAKTALAAIPEAETVITGDLSSIAETKNVAEQANVARKWPDVYSNALEPGWVATKMGGPGAPDSLTEAPETQVWLAAGDDPAALVTGQYFYHKHLQRFHPVAADEFLQEGLLAELALFSGVSFR